MSKKKETIKTGRVIRNSANGVTRLLIDFAFYTLVILAVIRFSQYGYNFCYQLFGSVAVDTEGEGNEVEFFIQSGDSTKEVAAKLMREGLIIDNYSFYAKSLLSKSNIQPGTYILRSDMDYDTILKIITRYKEPEQSELEDEEE
ncbi:MAG: endolytic transglycosylase MltG [Lachnospiraceae bacterium]|nr:endolytic transglycosylase MltG [Lachnospiraceae bacterium]